MINFISTKDTISAITNSLNKKYNGGYLRFGDGDANIASGTSDMYQTGNPQIRQEMIDTFALNLPNLFKAFPHHTHTARREPLMEPGNMIFTDADFNRMAANVSRFWDMTGDVYSAVALHQQLNETPNLLVKFFTLCRTFDIVFVGNKTFDKQSIKDLFGDAVTFVNTLPRDAYQEIDKLEDEINALDNNYKLYIMCCGMSSRILTKRLIGNKPGFFFDIGSVIDVFLAKPKLDRTWLRITNAVENAKYVKEKLK